MPLQLPNDAEVKKLWQAPESANTLPLVDSHKKLATTVPCGSERWAGQLHPLNPLLGTALRSDPGAKGLVWGRGIIWKPQGQKDVVCISIYVCLAIPRHWITGACDGHRWITSGASDTSGIAGSQQGRWLTVRWLRIGRSWGPSSSLVIYGDHPVLLDGLQDLSDLETLVEPTFGAVAKDGWGTGKVVIPCYWQDSCLLPSG